jgi:hypothetical protein
MSHLSEVNVYVSGESWRSLAGYGEVNVRVKAESNSHTVPCYSPTGKATYMPSNLCNASRFFPVSKRSERGTS